MISSTWWNRCTIRENIWTPLGGIPIFAFQQMEDLTSRTVLCWQRTVFRVSPQQTPQYSLHIFLETIYYRKLTWPEPENQCISLYVCMRACVRACMYNTCTCIIQYMHMYYVLFTTQPHPHGRWLRAVCSTLWWVPPMCMTRIQSQPKAASSSYLWKQLATAKFSPW